MATTKASPTSSRRGAKPASVQLREVTARLEKARATVLELEAAQGALLEARLEEGASLRVLGEEVGVSHQTVRNIVDRRREAMAEA